MPLGNMGVSPDTLFNDPDHTIILADYLAQGRVGFRPESGPIAEFPYIGGFALPEHLGMSFSTKDPYNIFPGDVLEFTRTTPLPPGQLRGYARNPDASLDPPQDKQGGLSSEMTMLLAEPFNPG